MPRKKKVIEAPPQEPWKEYTPGKAMYWMQGGPFVPVDEIPAEPYDATQIATNMKPKGRRVYLEESLKANEESLAAEKGRYLETHEKGMEAVPKWLRENWQHKVHTCSVKVGDTDPVSDIMSSAYRMISLKKGQIEGINRVLDQMDEAKSPLFRGKAL